MRSYKRLKGVLDKLRVSQRACAEAVGISAPAMSKLVQHGAWPIRKEREVVQRAITEFLKQHGATEEDVAALFGIINTPAADAEAQPKPTEEQPMFIRRQSLFPETRRHFGLTANPFLNDIQGVQDVYLSKDGRYVLESMYQVARNGGFLAVLGQSGAGKTVLKLALQQRLVDENQPVIVIEPYVLGMEDNDKKGKTLRSTHIAEAILHAVSPDTKVLASPEARFRQVDKALRASRRASHAHALIIEEAHCLSMVLLKHLKRYLELRDGMGSLLSIILVGQPELGGKLSESNYEVREVVQRCEVVNIPAMNGNLGEYLAFKFGRAGVKELGKIITEDGLDALRARLAAPNGMNRQRGHQETSWCHPLAVGNFMIAAMNVAAEAGAPVVDAETIKAV